MTPDELQERLTAFLQRTYRGRLIRVEDLRLLTGGASRQTWSFDAVVEGSDGETATEPLILRADPRTTPGLATGDMEFALLGAALLRRGDEAWRLSHLCVRKVTRKRGVGRRLLEETQRQASEAGKPFRLAAPEGHLEASALAARTHLPLDSL